MLDGCFPSMSMTLRCLVVFLGWALSGLQLTAIHLCFVLFSNGKKNLMTLSTEHGLSWQSSECLRCKWSCLMPLNLHRKVCTTCRVKWFLLLITYQPDHRVYLIFWCLLLDLSVSICYIKHFGIRHRIKWCCIITHHWDSCSSLLQSIDYWPSIRARFEWSQMGHCDQFIISVIQLSYKFSFFIHADFYLHCGWMLTSVMLSMNPVRYKVR